MFFRRSSPSAPASKVEIHLDQSTQDQFHPGSLVSGRVVFSSLVDVAAARCQVEFIGLTSTYIRRSQSDSNASNNTTSTTYRHYRDRAFLFHFEIDLLHEGGQLVANQRYERPFRFFFPQGTDHDRTSCYEDPRSDLWTALPHLLPPTFIHSSNQLAYDKCSVEYKLEASLYTTGPDPNKASFSLHFQPDGTAPRPRALQKFNRTHKLSSSVLSGHPDSSSFRQRISDKFSKDTPSITFTLSCTVPSAPNTGDIFTVQTTLRIEDRSINTTVIPPVTLRIKKLKLKEMTLYRAPRDWAANDSMSGGASTFFDDKPRASIYKSEEMGVDEDSVALNAVPDSQTIPPRLEKGVDIFEGSFQARIPGITPPSFRTYAINRSYRLKVCAVAELGGKSFELEFEAANLTVLLPPALALRQSHLSPAPSALFSTSLLPPSYGFGDKSTGSEPEARSGEKSTTFLQQ